MEHLIFSTDINTSGTYLRDYLVTRYSFRETVARLYELVPYDIFENSDKKKRSFKITGMFQGQIFTLYDYKCDREIHIGGHDKLNVEALNDKLLALLKTCKPKDFVAKYYYRNYKDITYSYP